MTQAEKEERRALWRGIVRQWSESGETKAGFCRERNLPEWQFHYWFSRFRDGAAADEGFIRAEVPSPTGVLLRLPGGLFLELAEDFNADVLRRFLEVAGRAC